MPTAAPHGCAGPGCRALVPRGRARCQDCERQQESRRGSAHARGYDARWRKYRLTYLAANPLCVLCLAEGRTEAAIVVDHVQAHKGDEALFWDPNNHRALCKPHHDRIVSEGDFKS